LGSERKCECTKYCSQIARAFGPGGLGPVFGPFRLALGPKPVQNRCKNDPWPSKSAKPVQHGYKPGPAPVQNRFKCIAKTGPKPVQTRPLAIKVERANGRAHSPRQQGRVRQSKMSTLRYALVLPGRKSGFRAGCRPDSSREKLKTEERASGRTGERANGRVYPTDKQASRDSKVCKDSFMERAGGRPNK
jgi:hypothetical protein